MNIVTTGSDRAALIQGLIDLAAFLECHPDVPVASYEGTTAHLELMVFPQGAMTERRGDVDVIAGQIGEPAITTPVRGHYETERHFGPAVSYKAVAIAPQPAVVPAVRAA